MDIRIVLSLCLLCMTYITATPVTTEKEPEGTTELPLQPEDNHSKLFPLFQYCMDLENEGKIGPQKEKRGLAEKVNKLHEKYGDDPKNFPYPPSVETYYNMVESLCATLNQYIIDEVPSLFEQSRKYKTMSKLTKELIKVLYFSNK